MSSTGADAGLPDVVGLLKDARVVDTNGVAAAALLAYDIVITWGSEYELIWKSRASVPKFLYIFTRYFGLAILLVGSGEATNSKVTDHCRSFTLFDSIASALVIMAVQATLAIRVCALYGRTKFMTALIGGLFIANVVTMFTIDGLALGQIVSVPAPPPLSGCFGVGIPSYFTYVWTPNLIFECFLFILTLYQLFRPINTRGIARMPITTLFFRDGTVYFAVTFVAFLIQTILYHQSNEVLAQVAICWLQAFLCIAGPRLLLNLRALARRYEDCSSGQGETWWSTFGPEPEHDDLAFRMGPTQLSATTATATTATTATEFTEGSTAVQSSAGV